MPSVSLSVGPRGAVRESSVPSASARGRSTSTRLVFWSRGPKINWSELECFQVSVHPFACAEKEYSHSRSFRSLELYDKANGQYEIILTTQASYSSPDDMILGVAQARRIGHLQGCTEQSIWPVFHFSLGKAIQSQLNLITTASIRNTKAPFPSIESLNSPAHLNLQQPRLCAGNP